MIKASATQALRPVSDPLGNSVAREKCVFPDQLVSDCWLSQREISGKEGSAPKTTLCLLCFCLQKSLRLACKI